MESSAKQSTNQPTLHTTYPSILEQLCRQMAPPQPLVERSDADETISSDLSTETPASTSSVSLQKILTAYRNSGRICSTETNDEETKHDQPMPFRESGVTDLLVAKLLLKDYETQQKTDFVACLSLTRTLVTILPAWYLPALSQSVSDLVSSAPQRISWQKLAHRGTHGNDNPTVLQLWVSLLANGSAPLGVHDQLSGALVKALSVDRATESSLLPTLRHDATAALVDEWRKHLADASVAAAAAAAAASSSSSGKVASVRCATVWMRMVSSWRLPRDSIGDGLGLLLPMLRDGSDPLQQMSLLDAMIQDLDPSGGDGDGVTDGVSNDISAAECWSVPELVEVAVSFLRDPLLSDAALRYLGGLSSSHLSPDAQRLIVEHVRGVCDARGGRPPTRDSERLPLVRALYHMASASAPSSAAAARVLDTILGDPVLRSAWWDLSQTSNPKLRAAVLVSVARCLPRVAEAREGDASRALRLYRCLGPDNTRRGGATGTTRWLLDTAATSPIPEPRIASHALLAAMLRLPNHRAEVTNELVADPSATLSLVLDVLLAPTHETTTPDAQRARFDVLEAFMDHHCGGNNENNDNDNDNQSPSPSPVLAAACGITPSILRKLRSQRALGPYGKQVVRYGVDDDVA